MTKEQLKADLVLRFYEENKTLPSKDEQKEIQSIVDFVFS